MVDLPGLFAAPKSIAVFPGWSAPDDTGYMIFAAPLKVAGVVEPNFNLGASKNPV